jgi:hypothetical protein
VHLSEKRDKVIARHISGRSLLADGIGNMPQPLPCSVPGPLASPVEIMDIGREQLPHGAAAGRYRDRYSLGRGVPALTDGRREFRLETSPSFSGGHSRKPSDPAPDLLFVEVERGEPVTGNGRTALADDKHQPPVTSRRWVSQRLSLLRRRHVSERLGDRLVGYHGRPLGVCSDGRRSKIYPAPWGRGFCGLTAKYAQRIGSFQGLHAIYCCSMRPIAPPPVVIFHDTTLIALANRRPQSLAALGEIPGMGERKIERYGKAMLAIIRGEDGPLGED